MVVTITSQKGGSGKTTLATSLAAELYARGRSVCLVDADPQGTALVWHEVASEEGHEGPTCVRMGEGLHRAGQVPALADRFDDVLIDTPPQLGKVSKQALMVSDVALVPCGPGTADVWSIAATAEIVLEAQDIRPALRAAIVITKQQPGTTLSANVREALAESGLPILEAEIGHRVAFPEALGAGLGVTQYARTSTAADELRSLVDELERMRS